MKKAILSLLTAAIACGGSEEESSIHITGVCEADATWAMLPDEVQETSGVAASMRSPGVFWTHNDSEGDSAIFAIDSTGALLARVRIAGATNRDWEDVAVAPCAPGSDETCIYIADTGDNSELREAVVVYRVPEPDPGSDSVSTTAERLEATYPDAPRDTEALYVTPQGLHLITKGRRGSIELFRMPAPLRPGPPTTLTLVQQLAPPPTSVSAQVTAAAATADGRTVVVRTYSGLRFFEPHGDTLRPLGTSAGFLGPAQPQGEGVDFIDPARLVLTGEAAGRQPATIAFVRCEPRAPPPDTASSRIDPGG